MDLIETSAGPRHPWETSRASFFRAILGHAFDRTRPLDVLDCGAGDAFFSSGLGEVIGVRSLTCWDAHYDDATLAKLSAEHPSTTFTREMPARRFDLVLMLDVIEHVEDDVGFVTKIVDQCLAPDGRVLVSVPAWQALYSRHDEFLRHYRRYSPRQCDRVLTAAGLRILEGGGAFHGLILPRAAQVLSERTTKAVRGSLPPLAVPTVSWNRGPIVTAAVAGALRLDNALSRAARRARLNVPGLSYWALARPNDR